MSRRYMMSDSEEQDKSVLNTLAVFKPLYKEHMNIDLTYEDAEEIRENLKAFIQALKLSVKEED